MERYTDGANSTLRLGMIQNVRVTPLSGGDDWTAGPVAQRELIILTKHLVFLRHRAYILQQSPIIIFSFVRPLGQIDFLVMKLLVRNEVQDV